MGNGSSNPSKADLEKRISELEAEMAAHQKEFDELAMDLSLGISEFFEVMKSVSAGDFLVRAPEDSPNELLANFGKTINSTIGQLGSRTRELKEINLRIGADLETHRKELDELAMDLSLSISEFFEVMRKVSTGDFSVRAPVDSPNELLANFGKTINTTIGQLSNMNRKLEEANSKIKEQAAKEAELAQEIIDKQRMAIAELTTPIIQVWEKVLCLPIVGTVDSNRAAEMMETLLKGITETECRCVIVDLTGVDVVDTKTADHFIKMIRAANLLGAACIITGISPAIAQTLTQIGVDLTGIKTLRSLKDGLIESFEILNLKVVHGE